MDHIIELLESPCYTNLFIFKAIAASHSSLPEHSQINFLKITRLDPEPLITLFTQANIHYLLLTHFLLFQASPIQIEKLILSAQELDICIPPSFVTVTKKISFEKSDDKIYAKILLATQTAFYEFQIQREDIGSTSEIFWTPDFLKYLDFRFLCQNQPQIKTVKSHQGTIKEVLAFTAPSSLLDTIPMDQIPLTFQFEGHTFMLSFLEPLYFTSPISITPYPFETQIEHFKRFNGQADSNSIRIPILTPHSTKGGPRAQDILNSLSFRLLPECDPPIHYIYSEPSKYFYLFLVSQDSIWIENLNLLFPQKQLKTIDIPVINITYHTPHFVLLKTFSDNTFPIPLIDNPTCKLLNQGWISATSFGSCFLLLLLPSLAIIDSIRQFIMHHDEHFEQSIIIGFFPPEEHILDQINETDIAVPSATVADMDVVSSLTVHDLPTFSPLLLISYRLLAYFTWNRTFSHVRQRLLEAVSGGLHSSSPVILPILTQCIDTFDARTFTPLPSFTQTFMQLCLGLPEDLQKELFPTLLTPTKRSSSPIIYLESFPLVTSSDQLCHEFKRIFDYLPESSKLIFSQPSLIFCCSTFSNIQKSHFLELFLSKIPITEESKANTSEPTRPIVLRLAALMLEPINPVNPIASPPLIIELYHEDQLCVTVYDPTAGVRSVPLSDLLSYQVIGVHFKRSSTAQLICPKLLQRFAALPIPKGINTSHSKFSIISLFDGSGSFVDVISQALEAWPHAILAAENDPGTRSIVAKVKGWPLDGTLWTYDKRGAHSFYAKDVWALIQNHCLILKQFLSLLPEDSVIFLAAGFPCPDLTVIGRGNGLLGLVGDRSVLIHCRWAVLYYLSLTPWWHKVSVLFENGGSMKEHMKTYIHELLGIPIKCAHYINCSTWGSVSRARYFFASSDLIVLPTGSSSPFDDGWLPALHPTKLTPRPLPPWLRPRAITDMGNVVQTPLAYHPKNLLYDIDYFSGLPGFQHACITYASKLYPKLPFLDFLPPFLWADWNTLESWPADFTVELTPAILKTVSRLQDFYSNPHIYLPFRLPSLSEKAKDSELSELLLATIEEASPPLFTLTICLYPSLPFLVCTPDYTLGTFSSVDDLTACFPRPAAFHAFSSNASLVRPDVFLRLPPAANFTGQPVEGRPDFVSHTPAAAMTALLAARSTTYQHCPSSRASVEPGSLTADLHFALYCTPYYGYVPENETDFLAMTFALADFLVYTCFTTNGEPNAALSNLSVRPGDLLTILSTIHPSFLSVSPGDGLFILPLTTSKAALRPFPVAWLYAVTDEDCPPPPFFVTLGAALGPGTDLYVSGIFQQAWALGPHARVYLNSSQLPLPYFRRTDELQVHTNNRAHGVEFGGYGAKQYHFVFSPDTHDKVSFANLPVTPEALPESFLSDLLALENWPSAATLLATPNNTISWPDNSSLRMWLPDVDSNFSPHHGITICCGRAGDRAQSHGPTLGYRDIHQESAGRQGAVWNSYFSHVPQYESLASVFYSSMEY